MAFEVFNPCRFQAAKLKLIEAANPIIEEYQGQGFTLTLRQLFYQFVARDIFANTHKNYKLLGVTMTQARDAGLSDWDAIEDRTRDLVALSTWASPAEIVAGAARSYREDLWRGQSWRCEVWIEKDALVGVIAGVCERYRVPYISTRGNISQVEIFRAGKRFADYLEDGITPIVLHLADMDPTGVDMTRDVEKRLSLYAREPIEVRRIALNMNQVRRYRPPPNPVKENDSRTASYKARFKTSTCWELDALDPPVIVDLIGTEIVGLIDQRAWKRAEQNEAKARKRLSALAEDWA